MSILGDILKSITKPGRDIAELSRLVSTVRQMDPSINPSLNSLEKRLNAQQKTEQYTPKYQSQEEQMGTFLRPAETTLRNAATVGAFAAPVGIAGNIASRAGAGALGGALGSYGMTPITENTDIMKILGGAALGGTVGAAIGGVEKGLMNKAQKALPSKVSDFGLETRGKAIGLDPNKLASKRGVNVGSSTQGKKVIKSYFDTMDSLGLPTQTSEIASQSSDDALRILNEQFNGVLTNADNAVTFSSKDTANIVNKINSAFKNNSKITSNAQYQELIGDLLSLGESYSPSQLNMIREKARELVNWSTSSKAAVSQRATSQVFSVIDDFFKSKIGGTSEVLSKMKDIYTVRPIFQAKAPTAGSIKVGTASTNIAVPSGAIQERIPSAVGETLQRGIKIPQVSPEVLANIGNVGIFGTRLSQALGQGGQGGMTQDNVVTNDLVSRGVLPQSEEELYPQGTAPNGMTQDNLITNDLVSRGQLPQSQAEIYPQGQTQGKQPDTTGINLMLAQGILSGKISPAEANAVLGLLGMGGTGGAKLTEKQKLFKSAGQTAGEALAMLEAGQAKTGKVQGVGTAVGKFLGTQQPGQTDYLAKLDGARMAAISALSGANVPPSEYERMRNLIPEPNDEYNIAVQKLRSFQEVMENYAQSYGGTDSTDNMTGLFQSLGLQ